MNHKIDTVAQIKWKTFVATRTLLIAKENITIQPFKTVLIKHV